MSKPLIQRVRDFAELAKLAAYENRLILLLVSQQECPYCHLIKEEIIRPMILGGDFRDDILIRELFIDAGEKIRDFKGVEREAADFAHGYGIFVTPTLLFLEADGTELEKKMTGINTVEMYWYYLSQSIQDAISKLPEKAS
ncbi:thioredoxin fold domain-containing protein [Thiolapillus sp.]|uniref:thioredoxin family protein n=1 Tax=Thiolapillus sp. TaxID=2017437 RepID=UPI0025FE1618